MIVQNSSRAEQISRPINLDDICNPPQVPKIPSSADINIEPNQETKSKNFTPKSNPETPRIKNSKKSDDSEEYEEVKIKWTPLLDKSEKTNAVEYGYSFGSKKVSMGPGFTNLRFMNHCLARAIKRHIDFSKGTHWFLQDL